MGTWQKRSRRDRLAALGQVSRSVPVTCAVSDGQSARILNERRALRPVAYARTRPEADIATQCRLCPVVVGLRQTRQRLRYKRQDLSWHYAAGVNGIQASA